MTSNQSPSPAEILAGAEQERHELLAQAARNHLSNVRSEARRYEEELAHIEAVFQLRIQPVPEVPYWITDARKADIEAALRVAGAASGEDLADWLEKTSSPGPGVHRTELSRQLRAGLADPARTYDAWIMARQLLQVSKPEARS